MATSPFSIVRDGALFPRRDVHLLALDRAASFLRDSVLLPWARDAQTHSACNCTFFSCATAPSTSFIARISVLLSWAMVPSFHMREALWTHSVRDGTSFSCATAPSSHSVCDGASFSARRRLILVRDGASSISSFACITALTLAVFLIRATSLCTPLHRRPFSFVHVQRCAPFHLFSCVTVMTPFFIVCDRILLSCAMTLSSLRDSAALLMCYDTLLIVHGVLFHE
ncbi:hypothetical protein B0H13DRAFT_2308987 [Mycena leptocephala]|nr:hypothetical protein B0H13DRAFT_2308987 [Mycena leptocephala]